jgi:hypothetical protein
VHFNTQNDVLAPFFERCLTPAQERVRDLGIESGDGLVVLERKNLPAAEGFKRSASDGGLHARLKRGSGPILAFNELLALAVPMFSKCPPVADPPFGSIARRKRRVAAAVVASNFRQTVGRSMNTRHQAEMKAAR